MPTERDVWRGLLGPRSDSGEVLLIEQPLRPSVEGGSGVFLARAVAVKGELLDLVLVPGGPDAKAILEEGSAG